MRQAARTDANQTAIVEAFRKAGASVQILSAVGKGCPDLLVGFSKMNILVEVKDGEKSPSERRLTPCEKKWHMGWKGQVAVIYSPEQAAQLPTYFTMIINPP